MPCFQHTVDVIQQPLKIQKSLLNIIYKHYTFSPELVINDTLLSQFMQFFNMQDFDGTLNINRKIQQIYLYHN